jgi:hypothetical protein
LSPQIHNTQEFCDQLGVDDFEQLKKAIYKGTNCGPWIREVEGGLQVGSIVDGSDAETETFTFHFPFEYQDLWKALDELELQAELLWHEANDEEGP